MSATPSVTTYLSYPGSVGFPNLSDLYFRGATPFNPGNPAGGTPYDAWCLVEHIQIQVNTTYNAFIFSSYEIGYLNAVPGLAANLNLQNLDNINWLLNNYARLGAVSGDVQGAIWKMMGSKALVNYLGPQDINKIDALVAQAMQHDGYVPGAGETIGVIVDPMLNGTHRQPLIVEMKAATLGDRVWHDRNADGRQDSGEEGIAGATVSLVRDQNLDGDFNDAGEVLGTTTTDAKGDYAFKGLTPGLNYQVVFSLPAGYERSSPRQADGNPASGANSDALASHVVVLAPGENNTGIDAGFYKSASLGDRVWLDANGNGQQDAGEAGVAGVKVSLVGGGADGKLSTTADNTTVGTVTDADGNYKFTGLTPGVEYQVGFDNPAGSVFTRHDTGSDDSDSDAGAEGRTQTVVLGSGENNTGIDAGIYVPASLGDRVWLDANGNGRQDAGETGVAGVKVSLAGGGADGLLATAGDNTVVETTTDAEGRYRFDGLVPGAEYQVQFKAPDGKLFTRADQGDDDGDSDAAFEGKAQVVKLASGENNTGIDAGVYAPGSLGDRVWLDANANGRQDADETSLAGVKLTLRGGGADGLLATAGDNTSATATTGANGEYRFEGLAPGVEYQVEFDMPAGSVLTRRDAGDDDGDSDADGANTSQIVTLVSGQHNASIDGGVYMPASLGDRVWHDANANGRQDAGEAGIAGVKVSLVGGGADGKLATADDNTVASATTDADGNYRFEALVPTTEYQLQFETPAGMTASQADNGSDSGDSDAGADGKTGVVTLDSGENDTSIDAGFYKTASLGDRLWLDANGNGRQDAGETGVAGATVVLTGGGLDGLLSTANDNTRVETRTDADGNYRFDGLTPGAEYQLAFTAPAGSVLTRANSGDDDGDSDAGQDGKSQVVVLGSGENNTSVDAGVYLPAGLGDRVWRDANANGRQDEGETGAAGVKVTLLGGGLDGLLSTTRDNTSVSVTTDANGNYGFEGLAPGVEYQVQFDKPAGSVFTRAGLGDEAGDSDAGSDGKSQVITLLSGESNRNVDAGLYLPASLGDRVWHDANANGRQDAGEGGIAGVRVTLAGGGADGKLATLEDNTIASVSTDANGNYRFEGLVPDAEYQVRFDKPAGHVASAGDVGHDDGDSDADADGKSQVLTLASGENNASVDAGFYKTAKLGDRVWLDADGNGVQDAGETGVAGVKVTLVGGGVDGLLATAGDNTSVETTTDADGNYMFENLTPGEYQVRFDKPAGAVFTRRDKGGNDAHDSDAGNDGLSQLVKLGSGENNTSVDAGIYLPASLGDRVWLDADGNGRQDAGEAGVAGARVTLLGGGLDGLLSTAADNTTVSTTTDADGNYKFEGLGAGVQYQVQFGAPAGHVFTAQDRGDDDGDSDAGAQGLSRVVTLASGENNGSIDAGVYAPASLGDRVWIDANTNGQQDSGELGAAGVKVTLIGGGLDGLISTTADNTSTSTTTDAAGNYKFTGLVPGMEYQVRFQKPATSVFTAQDKGADSGDSDADADGLSQIVKLGSGQHDAGIDAGIYALASIGNRVWLDANANGQQDAGEAGVAGVTVTLTGGGLDGLVSTSADNTTVSTTTDASGNYLFKDLLPGMQYQLTFGKPDDMLFTRKDSGADASDSDADQASGKSQVLTLASGQYNDSVDAGVYANASIGDRLWIDTNANGIQDDGATGLAGRTVTLISGGADGILSTTADNTSVSMQTGQDGAYNFSNLTPGVQYQVQFSKPTGYAYTSGGQGGDLADSDANATTGTTRVVTLRSGEHNSKLDAGLVNVTGDLSITKTDGLSFVTPGQSITYKIVVTNTGTAIAANAVVTDTLPAGLTNVTWTSSAGAGASGNQLSGSGSINDTVTLNGGASITYTVTARVASVAALETVADFSALGANTGVGASKTVNGITADAAYISGHTVGSATLWARNAADGKGIGVLSRYEDAAGGEAVTGVSNQKNIDVIRLAKGDASQWSSLWVSNLDADGSNGAEIGTLYWSDNPLPDLSTLSTKFTFKYGDFGVGAEAGDILSLRPASFNADAKYVFFVAGNGSNGSNNDFLVWKAGTVPTKIANTAKVTAPNGFIDTNAANNSATDTDELNLPAPVPVKRGAIGDTVWEDVNFNGVRDSGEAGIKGVTVRLLDSGGKVLETAVTDTSGKYLFDNLNAGSYRVEVAEPSGWFVTKQNAGTNDGVDSDVDSVYGRSGLISLDQGEIDLNWDAGLYRKASLGDKVWEDLDHDDIQDAGEGGIAGVAVHLYSAAGTLLASTKTSSTGNYKFSNLDPGSYYLVFDKNDVMYKNINMDTWMWGSKNIGTNDAIDSDVAGDGVSKANVTRTDNITLSSGENDMSWDATITPIAIDLNGDGVQTVARSASNATFDLLGNGSAIRSGWLSGQDGFLAVDANGNGSIDGIAELFGGSARGAGFAQLAGYDSNRDGVVDARDAAFGDLRIWRDADGDRATGAGELLTLAQAGVLALNVAHVDVPFVDAQGNLHLERSSAILADGAVADMTDVYFAIDARDALDAGVPTLAELLASVEQDPALPVALIGQPLPVL